MFTPSDFTDLILDTVPDFGSPYIQGYIVPEKQKEWADITESLIGHRLGFVYKGKGSIITAPKINARIESGSFLINSEDKEILSTIYKDLTHPPNSIPQTSATISMQCRNISIFPPYSNSQHLLRVVSFYLPNFAN